MPQMYDETFKKKMVRLRMEGRTINSIIQEYHISKSALTRWCEDYRKECQNNPEAQKDLDAMEEIRRLRKELEEAIGLLINIRKNSVSVGCSGDWIFARMRIITTGNTGRQIIMPKKPRF